jgi:glycosyltransferase involved in cell wall biosynthesis
MKVSIHFIQFLKDDEVSVGGGGIGTLISYLCPLLSEMGHEVTVYQCASHAFTSSYGSTRVVGIPRYPGRGMSNEKLVQHFREIARKTSGNCEQIEIFAADFFSVKNDNPFAICIQNGLAWDANIKLLTRKRIDNTALGEKLFRYRCQLRGLRRFETCYNRVAVDLYFLNWYRSFRGSNFKGRLFYNPNPSPAAEWDHGREHRDNSEPLSIIFARRLVPEKGTRMIAEVFRELLEIRPNLRITLAGEGPDEQFLKDAFSGDVRVTVTSYKTEDALMVHRNHDMAVVPSLCGEATCLSVLEAMAAGCAVVATNMGGTITEIIDGFNGLLCWPTKESLVEALLKLIDFQEERLRMQRRGWETSQKAFSMQQWRDRWIHILREIIDGRDHAASDSLAK